VAVGVADDVAGLAELHVPVIDGPGRRGVAGGCRCSLVYHELVPEQPQPRKSRQNDSGGHSIHGGYRTPYIGPRSPHSDAPLSANLGSLVRSLLARAQC
jgi:hypothetical protein